MAQVDRDEVVLPERELDPEVERDERRDREARQEGDLVEGGEVLRIAHREREVPPETLEGHDEKARRELSRDEPQDVGADVDEVGPAARRHAVLNRERAEEEVLADPAELEEVRAEAPLQPRLLGERTVPQLRGDRLPADEDLADPAPHGWNLAGTSRGAG